MLNLRHRLVLIGFAVMTTAQAQFQFGVMAGGQYTFLSTTYKEPVLPTWGAGMPDSLGIRMPTISYTAPAYAGPGYNVGAWYRSDIYLPVQFRVGLTWSYRTFRSDVVEQSVTPLLDPESPWPVGFTMDSFTGTRSVRINYLELPVQAQYYYWKGAHVGLGAYFGRRMFGYETLTGEQSIHYADGRVYRPEPITRRTTDMSYYARLEFGASISAGYDFRNGFLVGLSYQRALTRAEEARGALESRASHVRAFVGYDLLKPRGSQVYRRTS